MSEARRHLVIVGGGHAHVFVLKSLAMRPEPALRVTVVSPFPYATYSGMVPGVLAGLYELEEAQIDVRALAARAGAAFVTDRVVRIDAAHRLLTLRDRPPLSYDLLSLDIGSEPASQDRLQPNAPVVRVKPIEAAAGGIREALAAPAPLDGRRVVVVGAGSGGTEVALTLAARLRREPKASVTLCDRANAPLADRDPRTAQLALDTLTSKGIDFIGGAEVETVAAKGVVLADGRVLPASLVVWATGAAGPGLLAESGLPVDDRGFLQVGNDLRCKELPEIFAAGDCATLASHPRLAKAGVYAVRQAPVLAQNLRSAAQGIRRLQVYTPQRRFLSLLNVGDGTAIFSYAGFARRREWAWRLKDFIDRRFVDKYARPPFEQPGAMGGEMIPCGGCAAKVDAGVLSRVLARLDLPAAKNIIIGLRPADDAAVFSQPPGTLAVATADAFPPFDEDLFLVGRVAAMNAASDLYAMGAEGTAAIALVCLPQTSNEESEALLEQFLRGALVSLQAIGIPLVGGHTIAGSQTVVGFSMHGCVDPTRILRKAGARVGDRLVLSKPLGTGVVLAAARAGAARAEWVEAAHRSMLRSNGSVMRLLQATDVHACTDITGFGFAGHLKEMLDASRVGARLTGAPPALPGALALLRAGWRSSFHPQNTEYRRQETGGIKEEEVALLFDPQTSGGLLAAVPRESVEALLAACNGAGEEAHIVGEVTDGPPEWNFS
jgi:selenide,water dikinase